MNLDPSPPSTNQIHNPNQIVIRVASRVNPGPRKCPLRATPPCTLSRASSLLLSPIHPTHVRASIVAVARVSPQQSYTTNTIQNTRQPSFSTIQHAKYQVFNSMSLLPTLHPIPSQSRSKPKPSPALSPRPGLIYVAHPHVSPPSIAPKPRHKACLPLPAVLVKPHPNDPRKTSLPPISAAVLGICLFQCRCCRAKNGQPPPHAPTCGWSMPLIGLHAPSGGRGGI